MEWIDGEYPVGHVGFRVDTENPIRHTSSTLLTNRPAHTNQSHQPTLYGWCGSWNDTSSYGNGVWRVVRRAGNGRVQITEICQKAAIEAYLDIVGYPGLAAQIPEEFH